MSRAAVIIPPTELHLSSSGRLKTVRSTAVLLLGSSEWSAELWSFQVYSCSYIHFIGEMRHEWPFMPFIWAVASVNPLSFGSHIGYAELLVVYTFSWFSFDLLWRYRLFFSFLL